MDLRHLCTLAIARDSIEVPLASALMDTLVHNSIDFDCPMAYMSRRNAIAIVTKSHTHTLQSANGFRSSGS
eukprot:802098-Amphidinium_carterae.1